MRWGANTLKSWKVGYGFEKVKIPDLTLSPGRAVAKGRGPPPPPNPLREPLHRTPAK